MTHNDDDHERDTITPVPSERHAQPPPPWERGTAPGQPVESKTQPAPSDFGKTQPITPPTAEDVLGVFGQFRDALLKQIDTRDERILLAIQGIGSDIAAYYQRETKRGDEHGRWITQLRHRTHNLSSAQQAMEIRVALIEEHLGIVAPILPSPEKEDSDPKT